jgi:hypothetical protein
LRDTIELLDSIVADIRKCPSDIDAAPDIFASRDSFRVGFHVSPRNTMEMKMAGSGLTPR